jgi:hypothetical protein
MAGTWAAVGPAGVIANFGSGWLARPEFIVYSPWTPGVGLPESGVPIGCCNKADFNAAHICWFRSPAEGSSQSVFCIYSVD